MIRTMLVSLAAWGLSAGSVLAADMSTWEAATAKRCPDRHLEWICDGCWDDFLVDYERTLPKATQSKIVAIADYRRRCKAEIAGFSCEMSIHVDAINRLGLLEQFVAWGCARYRCEQAAVCMGPAWPKMRF